MDPITDRLGRFLNGRLTVTLVVLELDLASWRPLPSDGLNEALPFMPHRAAAAMDPGGDIGLGTPLCHAVVTELDDGPEVRFGRSVGTALDAFYGFRGDVAALSDDDLIEKIEADGTDVYVGPAGYCLSLWSTPSPGLAVLAVEQLGATDRSVPTTVDHRREELAKLTARLRKQRGDTFTFEQLGFELPRRRALSRRDRRKRLVDLIVPSSQTTRGARLARALTVYAEAGMQRVIDDFVGDAEGDFDITHERQETGYVPVAQRIALVTEPSVRDTCSAASTDGRLILLNIDSMSVHHDLLGPLSEHFISATMPVLVNLAAVEKTFEDLRQAVSGSSGRQVRQQVSLLNEVRRADAHRKLIRATAGREQAVAWSNSQQLASHLHRAYESQSQRISSVTSSSADLISTARDVERQEREYRRSTALAAVTVAAAVLAGFGVLAALVEVQEGPWGWLADYAGRIVIFAPLCIFAVVVGAIALYRRIRR